MTWADQHRRMEIGHIVLERAASDPYRADLFAHIDDLDRLFGGPLGLLLALQRRWDIHLDVKLELVALRGQPPETAYQELCAEQPELRALLDAHPVTQPFSRGLSAAAAPPDPIGIRA